MNYNIQLKVTEELKISEIKVQIRWFSDALSMTKKHKYI